MEAFPTQSWTIESQDENLSGLVFKEVAASHQLGEHDVLVELRAASLNYRDLAIAQGRVGMKLTRDDVIPGSDGAGVVIQAGTQVSSFKPGDRVVTHMLPSEFKDEFVGKLGDFSPPHMGYVIAGLGHGLDGTLTTHGVFPESCLVKFGDHLSFEQAATLTCSGLTAWNAVMGLEDRQVKEGDWVLVQGSGGVSVAALQFAVAADATVVATTSSEEKGERLRELGASHIINYRQVPEWGSNARQLTPEGRGFDIVVDVAGNATLAQSIQAARTNGLVVVSGMIGGGDSEQVALMSVLMDPRTVRGIVLGTRQMMRDMVEFVTDKSVRPALDTEFFALKDAVSAYKRLEQQKHFSKIIVQIPG